MHERIDLIDSAVKELEKLKNIINKNQVEQVNSLDEKNLIKATSYSWIKSYQPKLYLLKDVLDINKINDLYCELLDFSEKRTKRSVYKKLFNQLKKELIGLRLGIVKNMVNNPTVSSDRIVMPDFSILISDPNMIEIMKKRWAEIINCLKVEAPLAATVMMGGLLESVLMAKVNSFNDKNILFRQKSAPKDGKTKKAKQLSEWMLKDYIDVLNEIKVITKPTADFSRLIRDYRNYIHPEKELRTGESITISDASLFWSATASLIEQILNSK